MGLRFQTKARGCWLPICMTFREPLRDLSIIPAPPPQSGSSEVQGAQANCLNKTMEDRHLPKVLGSKRETGNQGSWLRAHIVPGCEHDSLSRHALPSQAFCCMHTHIHTCTYMHTSTYMHTCTHIHPYAYTYTHQYTCTYMYTHMYTHTCPFCLSINEHKTLY